MRTESELRTELKYYIFGQMDDQYINLERHIKEMAEHQDIKYYLMWSDKYDFDKHPVDQINLDIIKEWWHKILVRIKNEDYADFELEWINKLERQKEIAIMDLTRKQIIQK